jgi:hypothetical protein
MKVKFKVATTCKRCQTGAQFCDLNDSIRYEMRNACLCGVHVRVVEITSLLGGRSGYVCRKCKCPVRLFDDFVRRYVHTFTRTSPRRCTRSVRRSIRSAPACVGRPARTCSAHRPRATSPPLVPRSSHFGLFVCLLTCGVDSIRDVSDGGGGCVVERVCVCRSVWRTNERRAAYFVYRAVVDSD